MTADFYIPFAVIKLVINRTFPSECVITAQTFLVVRARINFSFLKLDTSISIPKSSNKFYVWAAAKRLVISCVCFSTSLLRRKKVMECWLSGSIGTVLVKLFHQTDICKLYGDKTAKHYRFIHKIKALRIQSRARKPYE